MSNRIAEYMKWHRQEREEKKRVFPREHRLHVCSYEKERLWQEMNKDEQKLAWQLEEEA